jgi:hypothetical protein
MRLPKHKLPKEHHKHGQTVKHKKSAKHIERKALKEQKILAASTVEMNEPEALPVQELTKEEKEELKRGRKLANAPKNLYKKQYLSFSGKHGPRAINRGGNF